MILYILGILTIIVGLIINKLRIRLIPGIPYPKIHPILGHIQYVKDNHQRYYDADVEQVKSLGSTFQIAIPGKSINVRTCDIGNIKHILYDNFDNYIKIDPKSTSFVHELLGNGIFAADGAEAKRQRKIASHMFSMRILRDYAVESFLEHGKILSDVLAKHCGNTVDMEDYFSRYTMDSFAKIAFGIKIDSLNAGVKPEFAFAFDRIQELMIQRRFFPEFVWRLQRFFQTARESGIRENQKKMHRFVDHLIDEREKIKDLDKEQNWGDIVSLYINQARKDNLQVDHTELRDIIKNFLLAGRDTTSVFLTWALSEFCLHPEWEEKCLTEINDVLRGSDPDSDNIQNMPLLEMFLNEVLRSHPPVPTDVKIAVNDDVWPDGTKIPRGTHCSYLIYAAGKYEKNWGSDCMEFNPERWRDGAQYENLENKRDFDYKFITFNAGPRICLGKSMAFTEAKICLALLLPRFKFQLLPNSLNYKPSFVLRLAEGLRCSVTQRE